MCKSLTTQLVQVDSFTMHNDFFFILRAFEKIVFQFNTIRLLQIMIYVDSCCFKLELEMSDKNTVCLKFKCSENKNCFKVQVCLVKSIFFVDKHLK